MATTFENLLLAKWTMTPKVISCSALCYSDDLGSINHATKVRLKIIENIYGEMSFIWRNCKKYVVSHVQAKDNCTTNVIWHVRNSVRKERKERGKEHPKGKTRGVLFCAPDNSLLLKANSRKSVDHFVLLDTILRLKRFQPCLFLSFSPCSRN